MEKSRDKMLTVRVSPEEYASVRDTAQRHGMDVSEYVRLMATTESWARVWLEQMHGWERGLAKRLPRVEDTPNERLREDLYQRIELVNECLRTLIKVEKLARPLRKILAPMFDDLREMLKILKEEADEEQAAERPEDFARK